MLLDTTFFLDFEDELRAGVPGRCASFLAAHRHATKHVSVVTMGEYAVGASAAATRRCFRGYQRLALGHDLAVYGGRLQATLPFELGENDLWIAATALRYDLRLVSRDKAFARIPSLRVIAY